jgi:hypothetical protein
MTTTETPGDPMVAIRIDIPSGVDGLTLVHFVQEVTIPERLPLVGEWSVTMTGDFGVQRCTFMTLHAAAHYAQRLASLADWTSPPSDLQQLVRDDNGLSDAMKHAEAHAHEIDAVNPPGSIIGMSNGPSIVDQTGTLRKAMSHAPSIEWDDSGDSPPRCKTCGDAARVEFGF